jgi:predicted NUDIX family NTP pyrophosphohydrolase
MYRFDDGEKIEVLLVHPGGPFGRNKDIGAWPAKNPAQVAFLDELADWLG